MYGFDYGHVYRSTYMKIGYNQTHLKREEAKFPGQEMQYMQKRQVFFFRSNDMQLTMTFGLCEKFTLLAV